MFTIVQIKRMRHLTSDGFLRAYQKKGQEPGDPSTLYNRNAPFARIDLETVFDHHSLKQLAVTDAPGWQLTITAMRFFRVFIVSCSLVTKDLRTKTYTK